MTPIEVLRAIRDSRHFDRTSQDLPWWMSKMMTLDDIVPYAYCPIFTGGDIWREALMIVLDEPETRTIDVTKTLSVLEPDDPTIRLLKHPKVRIGWSLWTTMSQNVETCSLDLLVLIPASRVRLPINVGSMNNNFVARHYVLITDILAHVVQWPVPMDEPFAYPHLLEVVIKSRHKGPSISAIKMRYYPLRVRQHLCSELVRFVTTVNTRLDLRRGHAGPR